MKFRYTIITTLAALLMTACNFSLASDITPPPDYVPPTPMPTLGALYPSSAPDPNVGASIFVERCSPCHGMSGLGDGPQSMQLPVTVPGIGLAEVAQSASPAQWFKVVSQGNLDRFMPPFAGVLSEQDRWNVVSYILALHVKPGQLAQGKSLFDTNCADCQSKFMDQEKMAALSEADLVRIIKNGENDIPAFGKNFSDDEAFAVAAYIRTLTFAVVTPLTPTAMAVVT
ncbi:MAG TPA: c-type cytochrome, partial [Anaerolineales bacterium]|nr:c-type cytochrome [Anaerolineales bacterium]